MICSGYDFIVSHFIMSFNPAFDNTSLSMYTVLNMFTFMIILGFYCDLHAYRDTDVYECGSGDWRVCSDREEGCADGSYEGAENCIQIHKFCVTMFFMPTYNIFYKYKNHFMKLEG